VWTRFVLIVSVLLGSVTAAGAIEPGAPLTVTPVEGSPFTVVTVSGDDCTDGPSPAVSGFLLGGPEAGAVAFFSATPDAEGAWTASFTLAPNQPASTYEVVAQCKTDPDVNEGIEYARHPFTFDVGDSVALTASPARAQTGSPVTVNVSGTLCRGAGASVRIDAFVRGTEEADEFVDQATVAPGPDGSWTGQLTIPDGPPATYGIAAQCDIGQMPFFLYDAADVVVSAPGVPPAPPARPLPARPTFTG
jgi:hypothetical protein